MTATFGVEDVAAPMPRELAEKAICAQTDPEAFFPLQGGSSRRAKAVCARCEVTAACLAWALAQPGCVPGVYGGLTENERRRLLGKAPKTQGAAVEAR